MRYGFNLSCWWVNKIGDLPRTFENHCAQRIKCKKGLLFSVKLILLWSWRQTFCNVYNNVFNNVNMLLLIWTSIKSFNQGYVWVTRLRLYLPTLQLKIPLFDVSFACNITCTLLVFFSLWKGFYCNIIEKASSFRLSFTLTSLKLSVVLILSKVILSAWLLVQTICLTFYKFSKLIKFALPKQKTKLNGHLKRQYLSITWVTKLTKKYLAQFAFTKNKPIFQNSRPSKKHLKDW